VVQRLERQVVVVVVCFPVCGGLQKVNAQKLQGREKISLCLRFLYVQRKMLIRLHQPGQLAEVRPREQASYPQVTGYYPSSGSHSTNICFSIER
jgi:hypothetical protein